MTETERAIYELTHRTNDRGGTVEEIPIATLPWPLRHLISEARRAERVRAAGRPIIEHPNFDDAWDDAFYDACVDVMAILNAPDTGGTK
jgi:hypothetical protein